MAPKPITISEREKDEEIDEIFKGNPGPSASETTSTCCWRKRDTYCHVSGEYKGASKACIEYQKKMHDTLSLLSNNMSNMLKESFMGIDNICNRVRECMNDMENNTWEIKINNCKIERPDNLKKLEIDSTTNNNNNQTIEKEEKKVPLPEKEEEEVPLPDKEEVPLPGDNSPEPNFTIEETESSFNENCKYITEKLGKLRSNISIIKDRACMRTLQESLTKIQKNTEDPLDFPEENLQILEENIEKLSEEVMNNHDYSLEAEAIQAERPIFNQIIEPSIVINIQDTSSIEKLMEKYTRDVVDNIKLLVKSLEDCSIKSEIIEWRKNIREEISRGYFSDCNDKEIQTELLKLAAMRKRHSKSNSDGEIIGSRKANMESLKKLQLGEKTRKKKKMKKHKRTKQTDSSSEHSNSDDQKSLKRTKKRKTVIDEMKIKKKSSKSQTTEIEETQNVLLTDTITTMTNYLRKINDEMSDLSCSLALEREKSLIRLNDRKIDKETSTDQRKSKKKKSRGKETVAQVNDPVAQVNDSDPVTRNRGSVIVLSAKREGNVESDDDYVNEQGREKEELLENLSKIDNQQSKIVIFDEFVPSVQMSLFDPVTRRLTSPSQPSDELQYQRWLSKLRLFVPGTSPDSSSAACEVYRKRAHCDLHLKLLQQVEASDSLVGFLKLVERGKERVKEGEEEGVKTLAVQWGKRLASIDDKCIGNFDYPGARLTNRPESVEETDQDKEIITIPKKKKIKIKRRPNSNPEPLNRLNLSRSNRRLGFPCKRQATMKSTVRPMTTGWTKKNEDLRSKYWNSLYFSPQALKRKHGDLPIKMLHLAKILPPYGQQKYDRHNTTPSNSSHTLSSLGDRPRSVLTVKSSCHSACQCRLLVQNVTPTSLSASSRCRIHWMRAKSQQMSNRGRSINYLDILDDISPRDVTPFQAEYPRKDNLRLSLSSPFRKVQDTYLYNLLYAKKKENFAWDSLLKPAQKCTRKNCKGIAGKSQQDRKVPKSKKESSRHRTILEEEVREEPGNSRESFLPAEDQHWIIKRLLPYMHDPQQHFYSTVTVLPVKVFYDNYPSLRGIRDVQVLNSTIFERQQPDRVGDSLKGNNSFEIRGNPASPATCRNETGKESTDTVIQEGGEKVPRVPCIFIDPKPARRPFITGLRKTSKNQLSSTSQPETTFLFQKETSRKRPPLTEPDQRSGEKKAGGGKSVRQRFISRIANNEKPQKQLLSPKVDPSLPQVVTVFSKKGIESPKSARVSGNKNQTGSKILLTKKPHFNEGARRGFPTEELSSLRTRNHLIQENIERAVQVIEAKMIDVLSGTGVSDSADAFNTMEREISQVLSMVKGAKQSNKERSNETNQTLQLVPEKDQPMQEKKPKLPKPQEPQPAPLKVQTKRLSRKSKPSDLQRKPKPVRAVSKIDSGRNKFPEVTSTSTEEKFTVTMSLEPPRRGKKATPRPTEDATSNVVSNLETIQQNLMENLKQRLEQPEAGLSESFEKQVDEVMAKVDNICTRFGGNESCNSGSTDEVKSEVFLTPFMSALKTLRSRSPEPGATNEDELSRKIPEDVKMTPSYYNIINFLDTLNSIEEEIPQTIYLPPRTVHEARVEETAAIFQQIVITCDVKMEDVKVIINEQGDCKTCRDCGTNNLPGSGDGSENEQDTTLQKKKKHKFKGNYNPVTISQVEMSLGAGSKSRIRVTCKDSTSNTDLLRPLKEVLKMFELETCCLYPVHDDQSCRKRYLMDSSLENKSPFIRRGETKREDEPAADDGSSEITLESSSPGASQSELSIEYNNPDAAAEIKPDAAAEIKPETGESDEVESPESPVVSGNGDELDLEVDGIIGDVIEKLKGDETISVGNHDNLLKSFYTVLFTVMFSALVFDYSC